MSYLGPGPGKAYLPPPGKSLDYSQFNDATTKILRAYRNKVINGGFNIGQRGFGTSVANGYFADRWNNQMSAPFTGKAGVSVPGGDLMFSDYGNQYFYFNFGSGPVITPAAGDWWYVQHNIEGYDAAELMWGTALAKPATLSFKALCNGHHNFNFSATLRNHDRSRSCTQEVVLGASGAPKWVTLTYPPCFDGVWKKDWTIGVDLDFTAASGSTYKSPSNNVWHPTNYIAGPNQGNLAGAVNTSLVISDVQLEVGSVATPYEVRHYATELNACQRFFERLLINGQMAYNQATMTSIVPLNYTYKRVGPAASVVSGSVWVPENMTSGTLSFGFERQGATMCNMIVNGTVAAPMQCGRLLTTTGAWVDLNADYS